MELNHQKTFQRPNSNGVKALNDNFINHSTGMFGLLRTNGAGKSTLMQRIATLQDPVSGSIFLE